MHLFRSEEQLEEWTTTTGNPRGATMSVDTCWKLARAWYTDKNRPDYRRKSPEEAQAVFDSLGLTGPFWALGG